MVCTKHLNEVLCTKSLSHQAILPLIFSPPPLYASQGYRQSPTILSLGCRCPTLTMAWMWKWRPGFNISCHTKAVFSTGHSSTRFLTAKIRKKMDGCFLFFFGVFIGAAETQMATQKNENSDIFIVRPL